MANQQSKPQYAWKQEGIFKRGWFPDKETCLNHCEQHESDKPVYLYKRVVIPDGWTPFLTKKYQSFRWEVKATRPDHPDNPLLAGLWNGPWFQNPKICLHHFKQRLQEGFEVPTPTYYLVMRRLLPEQ